MLHLIYGRSGYGKTGYLYKKIKSLEDSGKRVFLIVPEQETVNAESRLLSLAGNRANRYLEVINFSRLPNRVFREAGGISYHYIDKGGKNIVMASALAAIKPSLCEYGDSAHDTAFIKRALYQTDEFRNSGVTPKLLEEIALRVEDDGLLRNKLYDFSLIFSTYGKILSAGYKDPTDDLCRLSGLLDEYVFFDNSVVFIDGFYDFTKVQYDLIGKMMNSCDLYIALLSDKEDGDYFYKSNKAIRRILTLAEQYGCETEQTPLAENKRREQEDLRFLERNITKAIPAVYGGECRGITVTKCENPYEESVSIARQIKSLVQSGASYSEISVCAGNIDEYAAYFDIAFERYGIPCHTTRRDGVTNKPLIVFLLSALELADSSFYKPYMIKHLKCGLCSLNEEEQFLLETYINTWNISGRLFSEEKEWLMNPRGFVENTDANDREELSIINKAKEKVMAPLRTLVQQLSSPSLKDKLSALMAFLENSGAKKLLDNKYAEYIDGGEYDKANEQALLWNIVINALDQLVITLGDCNIGRKHLLDYLNLIFSEYDTGSLPECLDQVQAGDAAFMRSDNAKYLFLAGFNEGAFPKISESDSFFGEKEKKALSDMGMELGGSDAERLYDELLYFYLTVSRPSERLMISYSTSSLGSIGETKSAKNPSPFLKRIYGIFPDLKAQTFAYHNLSPMCDEEILEYLLDLSRGKSKEFSEQKKLIKEKRPDLFARYEAIEALSASGQRRLINTELLNGDIRLSQTRFEAYRSCKYSYFLKYMLKLREEPTGEFKSAQIGSYVHRLLEEFFKKLLSLNLDIKRIAPQKAKAMITEAADEYLKTIAPFLDQNSVRFKYLYDRISRFLTEIVKNIIEEFQNSDFTPLFLEERLGGEKIPYYRIPLDDGSALVFSGQIDRADLFVAKNGAKYLRVVDYKTHSGSKKLKLGDVVNGMNVQMLVYLFAMWSQGVKIDGKMTSVLPAGVLYMPAVKPVLKANREPDRETFEKMFAKEIRRDGLFLDEPEVLEAMEHGLSGKFFPLSPASGKPSYSLASIERLGKLMRFVESEFEKTAKQIKRGEIEVNPYGYGRNSCEYCAYRPVCRFEKEGARSYYSPKDEDAVKIIDDFHVDE